MSEYSSYGVYNEIKFKKSWPSRREYRIFLDAGANSKRGHQPIIRPKFPENCMTMKKIRPRVGLIFTARKRSLGQGNIFAYVWHSVHRRGSDIPACLAGLRGHGIPACLASFHTHTQGGSWGVWPGGVSRPTPKGVSRPTSGGLQAHTQGGLQAHTHGGLQAHTWGRGIPACTEADTLPADGYCCGRYASYWNTFLFYNIFLLCRSTTAKVWTSKPGTQLKTKPNFEQVGQAL